MLLSRYLSPSFVLLFVDPTFLQVALVLIYTVDNLLGYLTGKGTHVHGKNGKFESGV